MMRRIAVVGDKLSNDGEICHYTGMMFTMGNAGHQVALIDGAAYCPVCKTTGYIAKDGGPRRMTLGISEIALDQDFVVCGCPEHPRIFAMLAGEAWYDDMAETLGNVAARTTVSSSAKEAFAGSATSQFDELIVLRDGDGHPIAGQRFRIQSSDGGVFEGTTNDAGETVRVRTNTPSQIKIELLV